MSGSRKLRAQAPAVVMLLSAVKSILHTRACLAKLTMSVIGHVGRYEHPLRKSIVGKVLVKECEVLNVRRAVGVVGDAVVLNQGIVLANVVIVQGR